MTTIKLKDFDKGEAAVYPANYTNGAVYVSLTYTSREDGWSGGTGVKISPEEARSVAKALLKVADEVEEGD